MIRSRSKQLIGQNVVKKEITRSRSQDLKIIIINSNNITQCWHFIV